MKYAIGMKGRSTSAFGWFRQLITFCTVALLSACGGGSSSSGSIGSATAQSCTNCGSALVTLTDAAGDFLSYQVNVVSLKLTRSDGTVVETVPVTTQVDFAQLVNLSEIISAKQVPSGRYTSASMTLDYAGANIVVDNGTTGVTIAADQIINGSTSTPLAAPNPTQIALTLKFQTGSELIVNDGTVSHLALDFNLLASNTVTPSASNPTTVTVNPVLSASLVPDTTKSVRVRGSLVSVDTKASTYVVNVRPFNDAKETAGQVTIATTSTTTFAINGANYAGSAGLTQLSMIATGTVVAATGTLDASSKTFTATSVLAGSSVIGVGRDGVLGTVVARSGNTLTISNGELFHSDRDGMSFNHQIIATVGSNTTVAEDGQTGDFTIADISVGQRLQLSGTFGTDSSGNTTLDATSGAAQLLLTTIEGNVTALGTNQATLNLQSINGRSVSAFDFAGTGTSSSSDAIATGYTVSVPAAVGTTSLSVGSPAMFTGFVAPFGAAPPDFVASTVVSFANTRAHLQIRWSSPGPTAPFATLTSTELLLSQATLQATAQHAISIGMQNYDPSTLAAGLQIVPDNTSTSDSHYVIAHLKSWTMNNYSSFADLVAALTTNLNGTVQTLRVLADGPYNTATGVFSADSLTVVLND